MAHNLEKPVADRPSAAAGKPGVHVGPRPIKRGSFYDNREPDLADLLTDPIVQRLARSDGILQDHLIDLIAEVKVRLSRRDLAIAE
jgi:hypothetical protein